MLLLKWNKKQEKKLESTRRVETSTNAGKYRKMPYLVIYKKINKSVLGSGY